MSVPGFPATRSAFTRVNPTKNRRRCSSISAAASASGCTPVGLLCKQSLDASGDDCYRRTEPALIPRPSENILSLFYDPEAVVRMRILAVIDYPKSNSGEIVMPCIWLINEGITEIKLQTPDDDGSNYSYDEGLIAWM